MSSELKNFQSAFANWQQQLSCDPWQNQRAEAFANFLKFGLPNFRNEDWKYTNINRLQRQDYAVSNDSPVSLAEISHLIAHQEDNPRLVFLNGKFEPQLSKLDAISEQVNLRPLSSLTLDEHLKLAQYIQTPQDNSSLINLNLAFMTDGVYLHIPANLHLEQVIHLVYINHGTEQSWMTNTRNLIIAENNSSVQIIEQHAAIAEQHYFANNVTEIIAKPHSQVTHYKLQQESSKAYHIANTKITQDESSIVNCYNIDFGGKLVRNDLQTSLNGENAFCQLNGLFMAKAKQHIDNHTRIEHNICNTQSEECYKGILADHGRGVFNGKVYVAKDAQQTDAKQHSHNLILSEDAEIDTKPELEIYANDVKCAHGATVGQLDAKSLFYLQSRGLDLALAQNLLTYGFAEDLLQRIPLKNLREYLDQAVINSLPDGSNIKELL